MFYSAADPRDQEQTPDATPKYPGFFQVQTQAEAGTCYICGRPSLEFAGYERYNLFLHGYCWLSLGGGKASK
jgi:hypothetical protein